MPYNYLANEKFAKAYKLEYENSVIIFDESHNVPKACEDSSSFKLDSWYLFLTMR